jgi:F420-non-reducing hydrogenase iron-sulfur subunit
MKPFVPHLIGFLCNWCAYEGADAAGRARRTYPEGFKAIRVMCSGRVDPQYILEAFDAGADGVLILGCPDGSCHYKSGNVEVLKRVTLVNRTLQQFGIDPNRLVLDWVAAGEGDKFVKIVETMTAELRQMGPLGFKR